MTEPILSVKEVSKSFGGVKAVQSVSFEVKPKTIHAVIGPNGAGKSTLFNLLAGSTLLDSGKVFLKGNEVTGFPAYKMAEQRVFRTFQNLKLAPKLSVMDNILIGLHTTGRSGIWSSLLALPSVWQEEKALREKAEKSAALLGLTEVLPREAGTLSYGEQRSVELARALASGPELLLLDEPAAGLNMRETDGLAERIRAIHAEGITVLLVEHDMGLVMAISDCVTVLAQGCKIAEGTAREVQRDPAVVRIYLGEEE